MSWRNIATTAATDVKECAKYPASCYYYTHVDDAECSDAGVCDRSTGVCNCEEGYEGEACQRTTCGPNSCSGHGICQSNIKFAKQVHRRCGVAHRSDSGAVPVAAARIWSVCVSRCSVWHSVCVLGLNDSHFCFVALLVGLVRVAACAQNGARYINAWDSGKQFGCLCDAGYRGVECDEKECPSSNDPLMFEGAAEGRDCSGRGLCNYGTGECECFSGYTGFDCATVEAMF